MKISELFKTAKFILKNDGIQTYSLDVEILLAHALGISRENLIMYSHKEIDDELIKEFEKLIERRLKLEPIAYITGCKEFYGLNFNVSKNTLIPRPETELIIDEVRKLFDVSDSFSVLDLGCGSGCIGITIASLFKSCDVTLSDISKQALDIAKSNADNLCVNVKLIQSDWLESISQKFDLIVCNPPYIDVSDSKVAKETILYEPHSALYSANSGLNDYMIISENINEYLNPNGFLIIEHGMNQEDKITDIFTRNKLQVVKKTKDLSGIYRTIIFKNIEY